VQVVLLLEETGNVEPGDSEPARRVEPEDDGVGPEPAGLAEAFFHLSDGGLVDRPVDGDDHGFVA